MSDDEGMVLVVSLVIAIIGYVGFLWPLLRIRPLGQKRNGRFVLLAMPFLATILLYQVLIRASASDVQGNSVYVYFYLIVGFGWIALTFKFAPLLGLSVRDDVAERGNRAAAWALAGLILALTLCFAGGNIGNGPGWWVVLFSAALSTGTLYMFWYRFDRLTLIGDAIGVDRCRAAGLRLAGLLVGAGLILGRAVAGDWVSAGATVIDFLRTGWAVIVLGVIAWAVEPLSRPRVDNPVPSPLIHGLLPAALYTGAAVWYVTKWLPPAW